MAAPANHTVTITLPDGKAVRARVVYLQPKAERWREQELTERLESVRQQLGEAQGELKALKAQRHKPPTWWTRLFGGE